MKKWVMIFALCAVAGTAYFILSSKPPAQKIITVRAAISSANRCFLNTAEWARWFPRQYGYQVTGIFYNDVRFLLLGRDHREHPVDLRIVQLNQDSVMLAWQGELPADSRREMDTVLAAFRTFTEDIGNIYGVRFKRTFTNDSTLITLSSFEVRYPETDYLYRKIDSLRKYAAGRGAKVINFPMVSVTKSDDSVHFRIMVALSLDKTLDGNGRVVIKRFVPWKMIEGEVKGGVHAVDRAFIQLYYYRDDEHLSIMALPFQSLVTDRRQEPDSAKWVTKVCAPIS